MGSPQTAYSLNNRAGLPGQLYDNDDSDYFDSKPCGAVALAAGVMVELVGGVLRIAQGTADPDSSPVWGVVMFKDSMEPNPTTNAGEYLPGMDVPVLRRGRIWASCVSGITPTIGNPANFTHSSTTGAQGTFTTAAVSGTAGVEISATKAIFYQDGGLTAATPPVVAVELNLP